MDSYTSGIVKDAVSLANDLRKPENVAAKNLFLGLQQRYGLGLALFDETSVRDDIMPEEKDVRKLLQEIENRNDNGGHSGASWAGVKAYTRVILGKDRSFKYMNWINEAESYQPGCTEPLTAVDITANSTPVYDRYDKQYFIYDAEKKEYVIFEGDGETVIE